MPHVFDVLLGICGACVLTVGISPTKSMSTKNPKLGKTDLQLQRGFKGQVRMYFFCTGKHHVYMNVIDSKYLCKHSVCHMCLICFGGFILCSNCGHLTN